MYICTYTHTHTCVVKVKVAQSCLTLQPHGLYSSWNSADQNTGVGSLSLVQEIFPTQELNLGLPRCRWILYQLSHKGSSQKDKWAFKNLNGIVSQHSLKNIYEYSLC